MGKIKTAIMALAATAICSTAAAQSARWTIQPVYDEITQISDQYFVVRKDKQCGILDRDGKTVVAIAFDSITPFSDGVALVMKKEKKKYRISSLFSDNGKQTTITGDYYATSYPFFSEGLLGVEDAKGKEGYINASGKVVIPCEWDNIGPFREGWACVEKGKKNILDKAADAAKGVINMVKGVDITKQGSGGKAFYINSKGKLMNIDESIGEITLTSTFSGGQAYVVNKKKRVYVIDTRGKVLREEGTTNMFRDAFGAYSPEGQIIPTPWDKVKENIGSNILVVENNLYGYIQKNKTVLPAQFLQASQVSNGYAVVQLKDKSYGVLKFGTGSIAVKESKKNADGAVDYSFSITVPQGYPVGDLRVVATVDNNIFTGEGKPSGANAYSAELQAPEGDANMQVFIDKLVVFDNKFDPALAEKVLTEAETTHSISVASRTAKANKQKNAPFTIIINNPTDKPMTMQVSAAGKGVAFKSQSVTVPAKSKTNLSGSFTNAEVKETRTLTVKAGDKKASFSIAIKPLFEEL